MGSTISKTVKLAYQTAGIETGAGFNLDLLIDTIHEAVYMHLFDVFADYGEQITIALARAARHYGATADNLSPIAAEQLQQEIAFQPGAENEFIYEHYERFYNSLAAQVAAQVVEVE
jgi:hypothetical protein